MATFDIELGLANGGDAPQLAALARDLIEAGLGWGYRPPRIAALIRDADTVTLVAAGVERVADLYFEVVLAQQAAQNIGDEGGLMALPAALHDQGAFHRGAPAGAKDRSRRPL